MLSDEWLSRYGLLKKLYRKCDTLHIRDKWLSSFNVVAVPWNANLHVFYVNAIISFMFRRVSLRVFLPAAPYL